MAFSHIASRSGCPQLGGADITANKADSGFDPQETLAPSQSRNATVFRDAEMCYRFGGSAGGTVR
jgi:hypothetical protein